MRFAAVQFDIIWEDKAANHAIIERMLREAQPPITPETFVLLPELGDTGFSMNLERIVDHRSHEWAADLARRMRIYIQFGFAGRDSTGRGRNCAAIASPNGSIGGSYEKIHPFSYGKESQFYSAGEELVIVHCDQAMVCPLICYDLRFPELWRLAAINRPIPAEVFTIGASWPSARQHHWRALNIARAIENQAFVVAVNRVGSDPHLRYAGGSIIVSPGGDILAEASDQPCVLQSDLDLTGLRRWREEFPALKDVRHDLLGSAAITAPDPADVGR